MPWKSYWWWGWMIVEVNLWERTSLLMMLHPLQRNLHTRESQVAFLCGIYHVITLKREISLGLDLSYSILEQKNKEWSHELVDAYLKYFPPWNHHMWFFSCSYNPHRHGSIPFVWDCKTTTGQKPSATQLIFSALRASCMTRCLNDFSF